MKQQYRLAACVAAVMMSGLAGAETNTPVRVGTEGASGHTLTADELREQVQELTKRLDLFEENSKTNTDKKSKANWAEHIKFKGDIRYRLEHREQDGDTDRNRHSMRVRVGLYGDVNDQINYGIRLGSGNGESPVTTNQEIGNASGKKKIWLDQAYFTYSPRAIEGLSATFVKLPQPWVKVADMLFDNDMNPEGVSVNYKKEIKGSTVYSQLGYFPMVEYFGNEEDTNGDIAMSTAQLAFKEDVAEGVTLTAGGTAYIWQNVKGANATNAIRQLSLNNNLGQGNSIDRDGNYASDFEIYEAFTQIDLKNTPIPIKLYATASINVEAESGKDKAWLLGCAATYKKLSAEYNYRALDDDATIGYLTDVTIAGGGSGIKGHKFLLKYELLKNFSTVITYFLAEDYNDNKVNTLDIDLAIKF